MDWFLYSSVRITPLIISWKHYIQKWNSFSSFRTYLFMNLIVLSSCVDNLLSNLQPLSSTPYLWYDSNDLFSTSSITKFATVTNTGDPISALPLYNILKNKVCICIQTEFHNERIFAIFNSVFFTQNIFCFHLYFYCQLCALFISTPHTSPKARTSNKIIIWKDSLL